MLRHWAHSIFCKEIRAARGIVVDRILSEHDFEWRDVPNLDISDENYEGQREEFGIEAGNDDDIVESSPIDFRLLFTDGKDPTGDGLYPAVTTEGLLFPRQPGKPSKKMWKQTIEKLLMLNLIFRT